MKKLVSVSRWLLWGEPFPADKAPVFGDGTKPAAKPFGTATAKAVADAATKPFGTKSPVAFLDADRAARVRVLADLDTEGPRPWRVGDPTIYIGKTYRFPGEVCGVTDDGQVVVKAYGDASGNYTGMKHIFGPTQLQPYDWGIGDGVAPLVIFASTPNPVVALREWATGKGKGSQAANMINRLLELAEQKET